MKTMKKFFKEFKAYTLAEVIIVMLIIAVVGGVSIKITKAKLDNIISYTYYSGYSTLRNVTGQMIADFNPNDEDYTDVAALNKDKKLPNVFLLAINWLSDNFELPAWAADLSTDLGDGCLASMATCPSGKIQCTMGSVGAEKVQSSGGNCHNGTEGFAYIWCCPLPSVGDGDLPLTICPIGKTYNSSLKKCVCSTTCGANETQNSSTCECTPNTEPDACSIPSEEEKQQHYCRGEQFNETTCAWENISPWPPCTGEQSGYRWSVDSCACVPETSTLPRKGANFCDKFASYVNTKSNAEECSGDAIASNLTDFSDKTPDIVLRNGLKLYNVRQNPTPLAQLAGNNQGGSYDLEDGTVVNVGEYGYTVYVDIDGDRGSSTLWEDVYPFYITMSGRVIPAYNTAAGAEATGGTSRQHLMTSVQKETITATGHRQITWLKKSVTFKESACSSGYIDAATPYCTGETINAQCTDGANACILKYISPVKFF